MKPLILDYSTVRTGDTYNIYEYDHREGLNVVVTTDLTKRALIDMSESELKEVILSKNDVNANDLSDVALLELETKTEAARERDDEEFSFLELQTKTFQRKERDDESSYRN